MKLSDFPRTFNLQYSKNRLRKHTCDVSKVTSHLGTRGRHIRLPQNNAYVALRVCWLVVGGDSFIYFGQKNNIWWWVDRILRAMVPPIVKLLVLLLAVPAQYFISLWMNPKPEQSPIQVVRWEFVQAFHTSHINKTVRVENFNPHSYLNLHVSEIWVFFHALMYTVYTIICIHI